MEYILPPNPPRPLSTRNYLNGKRASGNDMTLFLDALDDIAEGKQPDVFHRQSPDREKALGLFARNGAVILYEVAIGVGSAIQETVSAVREAARRFNNGDQALGIESIHTLMTEYIQTLDSGEESAQALG